MNRIKVLLFATLRDRAGTRELVIEVPDGINVGGLKVQLASQYPALQKSLQSVLVSINRQYAFDDDVIPASGEVALFPPVSGG